MRNKISFQHFQMCQRKQLFYKSLVNRKFFSVRLIKRISRNVAKSGSGMSFNTLFEDVLFSELPVYVHIVYLLNVYFCYTSKYLCCFFFKQMHFKNIKISKSTVVLTWNEPAIYTETSGVNIQTLWVLRQI